MQNDPERPKGSAQGPEREAEEEENDDARPQARSYYYDDAHGYEDFRPEGEIDEGDVEGA